MRSRAKAHRLTGIGADNLEVHLPTLGEEGLPTAKTKATPNPSSIQFGEYLRCNRGLNRTLPN